MDPSSACTLSLSSLSSVSTVPCQSLQHCRRVRSFNVWRSRARHPYVHGDLHNERVLREGYLVWGACAADGHPLCLHSTTLHSPRRPRWIRCAPVRLLSDRCSLLTLQIFIGAVIGAFSMFCFCYLVFSDFNSAPRPRLRRPASLSSNLNLLRTSLSVPPPPVCEHNMDSNMYLRTQSIFMTATFILRNPEEDLPMWHWKHPGEGRQKTILTPKHTKTLTAVTV